MLFLLIESVVGFIHFRNILKQELRMIRMAKKIEGLFTAKKMTASTPLAGEYRPRIANTLKGPKVIWDYEGQDEMYSSSSSGEESSTVDQEIGAKQR